MKLTAILNLDESSPTLDFSSSCAENLHPFKSCHSDPAPAGEQPASPCDTNDTVSLGLINQSDAILDSPTTTLRLLYLGFVRKKSERGRTPMTYLDVAYRYGAAPAERAMQAIDGMREVYGVRNVVFNEKDRTVRVEFDASRLTEDAIAKLLRQAGIDVRDKLALA